MVFIGNKWLQAEHAELQVSMIRIKAARNVMIQKCASTSISICIGSDADLNIASDVNQSRKPHNATSSSHPEITWVNIRFEKWTNLSDVLHLFLKRRNAGSN